jgi:protein-L-isoaspartate(D-aspartate) O-methyltransferase
LVQGVENAIVLAADGRRGCSSYAPFDCIVAWATAERIPQEWVTQLQPEGVIVTPVVLGPLAHSTAVVRLRQHGKHDVRGESIIAGSFVPLSETSLQEFGKAPADADVIVEPDSDPVTWLSAIWLREAVSQSELARLRARCLGIDEAAGVALLAAGESSEAFRAYLLAVFPEGLTTACLLFTGRAGGYSTREGAAFVSLRDGRLYASGHESAVGTVIEWAAEWRSRGCPGFEELEPIAKQGADGWSVCVKLKELVDVQGIRGSTGKEFC